jgi:hypothetical protein
VQDVHLADRTHHEFDVELLHDLRSLRVPEDLHGDVVN